MGLEVYGILLVKLGGGGGLEVKKKNCNEKYSFSHCVVLIIYNALYNSINYNKLYITDYNYFVIVFFYKLNFTRILVY